MLGEMTAEGARARHRVEGADEVPRDRMQPRAARKLALDIGQHRLEGVLYRRIRSRLAKQQRIDIQQPPWVLVGRASQHHAIDTGKMRPRLVETRDSAVDDDGYIRQRGLEAIDAAVIERRDIAVFLGRQAVEPGFSRVN